MKKAIACLLALVLSCGVFTGCGKTEAEKSTEALTKQKAPEVYVKIHDTVSASFSAEDNGEEVFLNYVTKPIKWNNSNFDSKLSKDDITKNHVSDGSVVTMAFEKTTPTTVEVVKNDKTKVEVKDNTFVVKQDKKEDVYKVTCTFKTSKGENSLVYSFIITKNEE